MIALGLDISTSCTGWCVLSESGDISDIGYIDLSKIKCIFEKASKVEEELEKVFGNHQIDKIFIEENLQSFRSGFSSASTISTLAKFNGIVSFICFKISQIKPDFFNVNTARRLLGIKIIRKKDGGLPTKVQVVNWAKSNVDYQWPEKKLKSGPRRGQVVLDPKAYDMVDSYVICRAGMISCK